nr:EOG090X06KU [Cyclestheria hislopi]
MIILEDIRFHQIIVGFLLLMQLNLTVNQSADEELPEGYFPFEESPARAPPRVRRPPYAQADVDCPGIHAPPGSNGVQSLDNLCGDLNKGYIPKNPLGHSINGQAYPFELIRMKTLDFFSSTLPILKQDKNLPKVAKYDDFEVIDRSDQRRPRPAIKRKGVAAKTKRSSEEEEVVRTEKEDTPTNENETSARQARGLCDKNYGVLCTIFNILNGRLFSAMNPVERVENPDLLHGNNVNHNNKHNIFGDEPLTPCPSAAEYVTPVYAKNYQGVWRYVVQIPYEGYFTQTVEVTKCLRKKCHFMDGSCLASPRWVSLLVAELFYPHARFPATKPGPNFRSLSSSRLLIPPRNLPEMPFIPLPTSSEQETSRTRRQAANATASTTSKPAYCDGVDEIGCFQVRLYYDWFLVPGSCKCWKQDFFTKYGRKRRK